MLAVNASPQTDGSTTSQDLISVVSRLGVGFPSSSPRKRGSSDFKALESKTLDSRFRGNDDLKVFS